MPKNWVCDWSHWQGELPAAKVQAEGFGMVKLKAGGAQKEGWSFIDPWFHRNAAELLETSMVPAAYWYLMPTKPRAQAAALVDLLVEVGGRTPWAVFLDVEQPGLTFDHVFHFDLTWYRLTDGHPLIFYTRKNFWGTQIDGGTSWGGSLTPYLEEAHWVPFTVREDAQRPYASQQAHAIDPGWWDVNYSGWPRATMLQFTDTALVAGKRTTASLYLGTQEEMRQKFTGLASIRK